MTIRKPCRRCGGDKGPQKHKHDKQWYCDPCQSQVRKLRNAKRLVTWCGSCEFPASCAACEEIRHERAVAGAKNARRVRTSNYFRPEHVERWWQRRSHALVRAAIVRGYIPDLRTGEYACMDCGAVACEYDHRDYSRPFDVEPVCRSCNKRRGTASWPSADRFAFKRIDSATDAAQLPDANTPANPASG